MYFRVFAERKERFAALIWVCRNQVLLNQTHFEVEIIIIGALVCHLPPIYTGAATGTDQEL